MNAIRLNQWIDVNGFGKVKVVPQATLFNQEKRATLPRRVRRHAFFKAPTETCDFHAFMRGYVVPKAARRMPVLPLLPLMAAPLMPIKAFAAEAGTAAIRAKMMAAFAPIIALVQSLAYPVALLVVLGGGLFVMIGNSDKGFSLIQRAGLGYVLIMMLPMLMDVLVDAMSSVI